jgi:molybdate transport system ATP-binding protein
MQNLTIEYSGKKIIKDLDWRINKGERWALTGKNGSGKTTLFSLIYADHPMAYSQKVFLFGKRRGSGESIWDIKKRINYFGPEQIHFLSPKAITDTGREYILMQAHKNPERLNKLIDFFNAENIIDQPIRFLSSGQLQLVLLLNMFLDDKELLLLDEPFQFLDPDNHEKVTHYLNHYLDKDITLVLITHDEKDVVRWTQLRKRL